MMIKRSPIKQNQWIISDTIQSAKDARYSQVKGKYPDKQLMRGFFNL